MCVGRYNADATLGLSLFWQVSQQCE